MQPALLTDRPNLGPNVVGEVQNITGVKSERPAVYTEEVGKFAASTTATFE
jgi:hypothetical protein